MQSVLSRLIEALGELSRVEWQLVHWHGDESWAARTRRHVVEVRDRLAALVRDLDGLLSAWPELPDWSAVAAAHEEEAEEDRDEQRLRRVLEQVPSSLWGEF